MRAPPVGVPEGALPPPPIKPPPPPARPRPRGGRGRRAALPPASGGASVPRPLRLAGLRPRPPPRWACPRRLPPRGLPRRRLNRGQARCSGAGRARWARYPAAAVRWPSAAYEGAARRPLGLRLCVCSRPCPCPFCWRAQNGLSRRVCKLDFANRPLSPLGSKKKC